MRVLLADDQPEVRSALRLLLEHEGGLAVVGEVGDTSALLAEARSLQPELVLLDWELPCCREAGHPTSCQPADDLVAAVRAICPHAKIIALSGWPEARQRALSAGADGFVSKGNPPESLIEELRALRLLGES